VHQKELTLFKNDDLLTSAFEPLAVTLRNQNRRKEEQASQILYQEEANT
jgi:hypothetical protein